MPMTAARSTPIPATDAEPGGAAYDLPALLRAAALGDGQAWRDLVGLYSGRVFALVRSRVSRPDLAEEITQSVFVTIATKLNSESTSGGGGYSEQGRFESWLFRIAMNRVRDEVRRLKRHAVATDPDLLNDASDHSRTKESATPTDLTALRLAMGQLSDSDREVIELRHHAGLSFAQIADTLEEPLGTLLARHHRALRKLKDLMLATTTDDGDLP
jgi:RNA polymerase sigma-70 factor (ECF subfamily)